jgi:hypothetical protein
VARSVLVCALAFAAGACGPLAAGLDGASAVATEAPSATSPLVGTWVTEITREDLRSAGITAEGMLDENSGRFTTTFDADGTWSSVQESLDGAAVAMPVFEGSYEVDGDRLVQVTMAPEAYAGERLEFTWRIEGGQLFLNLANPPDEIQPVVTGAHPWSRATP